MRRDGELRANNQAVQVGSSRLSREASLIRLMRDTWNGPGSGALSFAHVVYVVPAGRSRGSAGSQDRAGGLRRYATGHGPNPRRYCVTARRQPHHDQIGAETPGLRENVNVDGPGRYVNTDMTPVQRFFAD